MLKSDLFRSLLSSLVIVFCAAAFPGAAETTEQKIILVSGATGNQGGRRYPRTAETELSCAGPDQESGQ